MQYFDLRTLRENCIGELREKIDGETVGPILDLATGLYEDGRILVSSCSAFLRSELENMEPFDQKEYDHIFDLAVQFKLQEVSAACIKFSSDRKAALIAAPGTPKG